MLYLLSFIQNNQHQVCGVSFFYIFPPVLQKNAEKAIMAKKNKKAKKAPKAAKKPAKKKPAPKKRPAKPASKPKKKPAPKKVKAKVKPKAKPKAKAKAKAKPKAKPVKAKKSKPASKKAKPAKKATVVRKVKPAPKKVAAKKPAKQAKKPVKKLKPVKAVKKAPEPKKVLKPVKVAAVKPIAKPVKEVPVKPEIIIPPNATRMTAEVRTMVPPLKTGRGRSSQPKGPRLIKAPIITTAVQQDIPIKNEKEPKGKFELEYMIHCSPSILFEFLATPSGLSEWFCDDVNIRDGIFSFFWNGGEQKAKLIGYREPQYVRWQWQDKGIGYYFEFRIQTDELTGEVALLVSDFADSDSEKQTSALLWDSQVHKLMQVIGSY